MEEEHVWFPSMTSKDHVARFVESTSSAELAGDVVSHARVHVGLTISSCI